MVEFRTRIRIGKEGQQERSKARAAGGACQWASRWAGWYQWCPLFQEVAALQLVCQISLANPLLNWAAGPLISLCPFASGLRPHITKGLAQDPNAHN